ncbi:insulin-like growth factor I [Notothenia coriiceps]|uniref:Insulin-like growth factor I n=1 Tax=Notothenia coriiceps TaxID=8208 RepID=A0A6I9MM35_9TELE|nr:PREDICTED: insulin-like growth factor I [Notothenia coriiceps]
MEVREVREEPAVTRPPACCYKTEGLLQSVHKDSMHSSSFSSPTANTLKVLCVRMCICLAGWPLASEAGQLRCGSDLLKDLMFVCGDRGIYLGTFIFIGSWSGYGGRPRGKGIVEQCCRSPGCGLQYLETYCNKPKGQQPTTAPPTTTTAPPPTSIAPPTATTEPSTTTHTVMAQQFQAVFQRRLSEHLGAPNSATKKKIPPPPRRKSKGLSARRRKKTRSTTSRPSSTSRSPPQRTTALKS